MKSKYKYREIDLDGKKYYQKRRDGLWFDYDGNKYVENIYGGLDSVSNLNLAVTFVIGAAVVFGIMFLKVAILGSLLIGGFFIGIIGGLIKGK